MSLKKIFFALSNPNRIKIYEICKKKKINITELQKEINQSYKSVLNNLRILEEAQLIKREKKVTDKAQATFISSIPIKEGTIYSKVYKEILEENKEK